MKLVLKVLFTILSTFAAIGQVNKNNFSLEGEFKNHFSGYIYIEYGNKIDSCLIVNNKFSFNGFINKDVIRANFYLKGKPSNAFGVYLEKNKIKMELAVEERLMNNGTKIPFFKILSIEGTKTADLETEFNTIFDKYLFDRTVDYKTNLYQKVNEIIVNYPKNPLGADLLSILATQNDTDKKKLREIYAKIDKSVADETTIKFINQYLYPENLIRLNDTVFDLELPDSKGNMFSTKMLKGRYYLIDFWASWCEPCKKQIPDLKRIYKLYKNKKFEIIAVSIDKDKSDWIRVLKKENLEWINVIENKGFTGTIAMKYHVNSIPANFLISNEGRVVAKNIKIDELEALLNSL